jgi:LmbE family N-acetylglucosaminyl deacetylase
MNAVPDLPPSLARTRRHLFLSPHYDDIPLSAGATVRLLADNGLTPETRVVFGSEPDGAQPLTAFAASLHDAWGLSADEVIARRKGEEDAAAAILGARSTVLPFRDAIYRGELYLSDDDLFGPPAAEEAGSLPGAIIDALTLPARPDAETRLYAPLGVGRHVDHQMVFRTGVELAARGWDVWFYEDVPYALRPNALASRLAEIAETDRFEPAAEIPAGPGWERKLDAILSYPSQLETVFRQYVGVGTTRDEIGAALAEFGSDAGTGAPVERFWRVSTVVGQINS